MIKITHKGNFKIIRTFLKKAETGDYLKILSKYGNLGVKALSSATPVESGKTASSWTYEVSIGSSYSKIEWYNTNVNEGVNIAIIIQYGHGTRNGGWVEGIDYINPAMKTVFDKISKEVWEEVKSL